MARISLGAPRAMSVLVVLVALACAAVLAACGASGTGAAGEASADDENVVVIDVRTPQEYAAGHVAGARNIDVQSPEFTGEVAALPASATYLVYCRSGNRSAQAAETMRAAGLSVRDGGGLDDMTATGFALAD